MKDDLTRSEEFFRGVEQNAAEQTRKDANEASNVLTGVPELIEKGNFVLVEIDAVLEDLLGTGNDSAAVIISRNLKAKWLRRRNHTRRMQNCLREIMIKICAILISNNVSVKPLISSISVAIHTQIVC